MNKKDKIKNKVIRHGKEIYLSAQDWDKLSSKDKAVLKEVLAENDIDADEYEERMKKQWPKKVVFHTKWGNK